MHGFCPLASGSRGNAIFVGTKETRILVDAGVTLPVLQRRLQEIQIGLDTIQAILVTHEHIDHIQGISALSTKFKIPIFANAGTAKGIYAALHKVPQFKIFTTGEPFVFADLEIHPFSIPHDTLDPVAFTIHTHFLKIGFCTDLGHVTSLVRKELAQCNYLYLEANHHPALVHASARPSIYKQRVLGKQGHLSNESCASLVKEVHHSMLRHIHLAHLSSECNRQELALEMVQSALQGTEVTLSIAFQEKISKAILF